MAGVTPVPPNPVVVVGDAIAAAVATPAAVLGAAPPLAAPPTTSAALAAIEKATKDAEATSKSDNALDLKMGLVHSKEEIPKTSLFDLQVTRLKNDPFLKVDVQRGDSPKEITLHAFSVLSLVNTLKFALGETIGQIHFTGEETLRLLDATLASRIADKAYEFKLSNKPYIPKSKLDVENTPAGSWLSSYLQKIFCENSDGTLPESASDDNWLRDPAWKYIRCNRLDELKEESYGIPDSKLVKEQARHVMTSRARYVKLLDSFYHALHRAIQKTKDTLARDQTKTKTISTNSLPLEDKAENMTSIYLHAKKALANLEKILNDEGYPCSIAVIEAKVIIMCQVLHTFKVFIDTLPFRKVFEKISLSHITNTQDPSDENLRDATMVIHRWIERYGMAHLPPPPSAAGSSSSSGSLPFSRKSRLSFLA